MKKIIDPSNILFPTVLLTLPIYAQELQENQNVGELEASVIVGEKEEEGFKVTKSESVRYGNEIKDSIESVQVLTSEVIESIQANNLSDVLDYAGGVIQGDGFGGADDDFNIRGLSAAVSENGIVSSSNSIGRINVTRESIALERVEVLKGPNAALYGQSTLGGVVNLVTKQPEIGNAFKSRSTVSSEGLYKQEFDINTSLGINNEHQFRFFSALEEDGVDHRDNADTNQLFFSGNYDFEPSEDLKFSIGVDYTEASFLFDRGIPFDINGNALTSRSVNLVDPDIDNTTTQNFRISTSLEARINDNWSWTSSASVFNSQFDGENLNSIITFQEDFFLPTSATTGITFLANEDAARVTSTRDFDSTLFTTRHELKGSFETGELKHQTLFGVEFRYIDTHTATDSSNPLDLSLVNLEALNIDQDRQLVGSAVGGASNVFDLQTSNLAFTAFDTVSVNDSLNIVLGGRLDIIDTESELNDNGRESTDEVEFSPTVGAVYSFNEQTSAFGRYSESFTINTAQDFEGNLLDPQEGQNFELGIRQSLFDDRLNATASVFRLEQTNRPTTDLLGTGFTESGTLVSEGFEFELQGKVTDNLSLVLNYTYNDTEFTESTDPFSLGSREEATPLHQASLFANYEFDDGKLEGLSLTGGVVFVGERLNTLPSVIAVPGTPFSFPVGGIELDSYVRVDVGASYEINDYTTFSVRVENLFDVNYEQDSSSSSAVPEAPRTVFASLELTF